MWKGIYNRLTLLTVTIANSGQNIKASHLKALRRNPSRQGQEILLPWKRENTLVWDPHLSGRIFNAYGYEGCTQVKGSFAGLGGSQDQCSGVSEGGLIVHGEAHKEESQRWGEGAVFSYKLSKSLADSCYTCAGENPGSQWKATAGSLKELSRDVNSCLILDRQSLQLREPGKQFEHSIEILGP